MLVVAENVSLLSKVHSNIVPLNCQSLLFNVIEKGKVRLLWEIPVQVLEEVSRLQKRSSCSTFCMDTIALPWLKPCEMHETFHCPYETIHLEKVPWKALLERRTHVLERRYYWCSWFCVTSGVKARSRQWQTSFQDIAGDTGMEMQLKRDYDMTGANRRKRYTAVLDLSVRRKGSLLNNACAHIPSNRFFCICTRQVTLYWNIL